MIEPGDYHDVVAVHLPGTTTMMGRHFAALALARLAWAETWTQAGAAINGPRNGKGNIGYIIHRIPDPNAFWIAIQKVADRMRDRGLIDYAARRTALADLYEVPNSILFPILKPLGMNVTQARQRHAAGWIWQRLTGGHPHHAPVYTQGWVDHTKISLFHPKLSEAADTALTSWGLVWLAERDIK
ncbi:hypothetical protein [Streptomyces acidicola]|uniref:hypothetical protein n=1 Tax=Streptomyces acidicola TaxID=2596892 RepID=UPI003418355D